MSMNLQMITPETLAALSDAEFDQLVHENALTLPIEALEAVIQESVNRLNQSRAEFERLDRIARERFGKSPLDDLK